MKSEATRIVELKSLRGLVIGRSCCKTVRIDNTSSGSNRFEEFHGVK
jgi:hypothetical protein